MLKAFLSDKQLIDRLRKDGPQREQVLKQLYRSERYRVFVEELIQKAGGGKTEASLIFEQSIIALDRYVRRESGVIDSIEALFEKFSKEIWSSQLKEKKEMRAKVLLSLAQNKKLKHHIHAQIRQYSGTEQDAEDHYQNGIIQLEDQLKRGKFKGGSINSYFYQLCFNLWRNETKKSRPEPLEPASVNSHNHTDDPQRLLERKEYTQSINEALEALSETCKKILRLKYFVVDAMSMDQIAAEMGFTGAQVASNTLSKCRKRLDELINARS